MTETSDYAASSISTVELYLMFSTDMDFRVNLDGLETFIRSRLGDDSLIYDFRAEEIPLGDFDDEQFIKLSVELPIYTKDIADGLIPNSNCFYHRNTWAEEAIEEVLLPAYMWIFAEIGIGNSHGVSSYFRTDVFDLVSYRAALPMSHWLKSSFSDGVRLSSRCETMSGNYENSWAQFRFILKDAKDYGDSKDVESIRLELENKYREDF